MDDKGTILRLQKEIARLKNSVKKRRYGLVWMDAPEVFEDDFENKLPILKEIPDLAIKNDDGKPTHILIEGDNYHALTCLNYTHKGKIDVIYIDPPYNTGSDGFRYKDKRIIDKFPDGTEVPKDHPFRHSYWLSFMRKRLELAKELLKEEGVIFISIDDNEFAQLKLLCDDIFDGKNFISCLPTIMNLKGNNDQFGFSGTHEYTLVYSKKKNLCKLNDFSLDDEDLEKWDEDEIGFYKKGANIKATSYESNREDRPKMYYPFLYDKKLNVITTITKEEADRIYDKKSNSFNDKYVNDLKKKYEEEEFVFVLPMKPDGSFGRWVWGYSQNTINKLKTEVIVSENGRGVNIYKKIRPSIGDIPTKRPKTLFYKPEYSSSNGTAQIKDLFGKRIFENPKPLELIKDFICIGGNKESIILDFFAGSGTTGHAILKLNTEDNESRQFILVTNNENNIMSEVCYPRIQKAINGYKNQKGEKVQGLGNSLKYYRTVFIGKNNILNITDEDKVELAHNAGELLAIAENTLGLIKQNDYYQLFEDSGKNKYTAVYFREELDKFDGFVEMVEKLKKKTTVYVFSWGNEEFSDDFDYLKDVRVKTIPQPILEIYKNIYNLGL